MKRKIKFVTDIEWMRNLRISGMVVGSRILFSQEGRHITEWLFRHEMEHFYQIARLGMFRFYLMYFWYALKYGYDDNPFEVEARSVQFDKLTPQEEELLWSLRNGSTRWQSVALQS